MACLEGLPGANSMAAQLGFVQCPMDRQDYSAHNLNCQHGGGGLLNWAYFAAAGPGHLAVTELNINSSVYQSIIES